MPDVIVIGDGPGGLSAALFLAKNGKEVVVYGQDKTAMHWAMLHNYLGIAYGNAGMVDDAVQEFEISLKINPYYLKARLNLALLYYENDRYEESQGQLDEVLGIQPDNQLANNLLSELRTLADGN